MKNNVLNLIDQLKYKIFGHAESTDEAREYARNLLQDSQRHDVDAALDYYHNTLLNEISKEMENNR